MTLAQKRAARTRLKSGAQVLLNHAYAVHYTQGGSRWSWRRHGSLTLPFFSDCSGTVTALYWYALKQYGVGDLLNGLGWNGGYTGTLAKHGRRVSGRPGTRMVGDLVFYGSGWPWHHVTMVVAPGMVFSHGSERGPFLLPIAYRSDVGEFRRYL